CRDDPGDVARRLLPSAGGRARYHPPAAPRGSARCGRRWTCTARAEPHALPGPQVPRGDACRPPADTGRILGGGPGAPRDTFAPGGRHLPAAAGVLPRVVGEQGGVLVHVRAGQRAGLVLRHAAARICLSDEPRRRYRACSVAPGSAGDSLTGADRPRPGVERWSPGPAGTPRPGAAPPGCALPAAPAAAARRRLPSADRAGARW